jgi:simple sugar transport system substrate-binding protein
MLGAQSIRPDMKVKIIWVNSWFDPGKEADAAKTLISQGADILTQHTDSPAAMQEAEKAGIKAFGQSSDMANFGPKAQLTSIVDDWGPYYIKRVKMALDGTWKSEDFWGGLKDGDVVMAPYKNMPDDVAAMAKATEEKLRSGALHAFTCPIVDQSGKTVECKGGKHLDDGQILGMNFYIKGIDDKLPQ